MLKALIPGSFDPPTLGHIDMIERTASFADVIVAISINIFKAPLFSDKERMELLKDICPSNVTIVTFNGLLSDLASSVGADLIVKGVRNTADYEYEYQMAVLNKTLCGCETLFMPTQPEYAHLSSTMARDVARHGGDLTSILHPKTIEKIKLKNGGKDGFLT